MRYVRARAFAAVAAAVGLAALGSAQIASAGVVQAPRVQHDGGLASFHLPYTDPGQTGLLTLCGPGNQPITHGNINTKPFVWRAVGDVSALPAYRVKGAVAQLFAFQPRPYTPPEAWSGLPMDAASVYSNPDHPMIQSTPIDEPLSYFTKFFPPVWDHLEELRLYLAAPDTPEDTLGFAAADLQINGDTWTMVDGGTTGCTSGTAVSREVTVGLPGAKASLKPGVLVANSSASQATPAAGSHSGTAAAGTSGKSGTSATAASDPQSNSGGVGMLVALSALVAAFAAATVGFWWRRRRRAGL
jgi:hypothetical protein